MQETRIAAGNAVALAMHRRSKVGCKQVPTQHRSTIIRTATIKMNEERQMEEIKTSKAPNQDVEEEGRFLLNP